MLAGSALIFTVMFLLVLFIDGMVSLDKRVLVKTKGQKKLLGEARLPLPPPVLSPKVDDNGDIAPEVVAVITAAVAAAGMREPNIRFRIRKISK